MSDYTIRERVRGMPQKPPRDRGKVLARMLQQAGPELPDPDPNPGPDMQPDMQTEVVSGLASAPAPAEPAGEDADAEHRPLTVAEARALASTRGAIGQAKPRLEAVSTLDAGAAEQSFGPYLWCVDNQVADGDLFVSGQRVEMTPDGGLVFYGRPPDRRRSEVAVAGFAAGQWHSFALCEPGTGYTRAVRSSPGDEP